MSKRSDVEDKTAREQITELLEYLDGMANHQERYAERHYEDPAFAQDHLRTLAVLMTLQAPAEYRKCAECGLVRDDLIWCGNCGLIIDTPIHEDHDNCPDCGENLNQHNCIDCINPKTFWRNSA